jgi:hypothetical protein
LSFSCFSSRRLRYLQKIDARSIEILSPATTPFSTDFPTATFAISYEAPGFETYYFYYEQTPAELVELGYKATPTDKTMIFSNPRLFAKIPFSFGNNVSDSFHASTGINRSKGQITMTVDAWGTLILPTGTYTNTLRVKQVFQSLDTTVLGQSREPSQEFRTTYLWYDNQHAWPLLRMDSVVYASSTGTLGPIKSIEWLKSGPKLSTGTREAQRNLNLTALTHAGQLIIHGAFAAERVYNIQIIGTDGRQYASFTQRNAATQMSLPLEASMSAGTYLVFVHDDRGSFGTARFTKL